jgi:DnaJ-class molecular chaperone
MSLMPSSRLTQASARALGPDHRTFRRSLADEVAIDFPSTRAACQAVHGVCSEPDDPVQLSALVSVSTVVARRGGRVPVPLSLRQTCRECGGRGETWPDRCLRCDGQGHSACLMEVRIPVPPGTVHGTHLRFAVTPRRGPRTRVDVRVVVETGR